MFLKTFNSNSVEKKKNTLSKYFLFLFFTVIMSFNNLNVPEVKREPDLVGNSNVPPIKTERLNGFAEEDNWNTSSSRSHEQQCCLLDNGKRYVKILNTGSTNSICKSFTENFEC